MVLLIGMVVVAQLEIELPSLTVNVSPQPSTLVESLLLADLPLPAIALEDASSLAIIETTPQIPEVLLDEIVAIQP